VLGTALGLGSPFVLWRWMRRAAALLVAGYVAVVVFSVWSAAQPDRSHEKADAIVVLGAAQYNGRPSPVLRRRLDHALALFQDRRAPLIVVTGGRRRGDLTTEASASANYLIRRGVPDQQIEREVNGTNTYLSLRAAARFLQRDGRRSVIMVTDGYHEARVTGIAREVGLHAVASPVGGLGGTDRIVKETIAVGLGNIVGYRRLSAWVG
jgi:uncharacterized SAM-binding protein YcdF (DUF218 family)